MKIIVHRGIDQIGGCITEIESAGGTNILIDLGHNLLEGDTAAADPLEKKENLFAILNGVSHVFYTHYHGDHIGFESKIPSHVKQHMGELAIEMVKVLKKHMTYADELKNDAEESLAALSDFDAYTAYERKLYGDIYVTPLPISHSAIDSYMFLIECDGHTILHTGDFRDHGYNATERLKEVEKHLPSHVDVLITEGTMLERGDKRIMSEQELQDKAVESMDKKYTFVLCSSMDMDRIVSFTQACQRIDKRIRIIADSYQIEQIQTVKKRLSKPYSDLFAYPYGRNMEDEFSRMNRYGFLMFVRHSPSFEKRINEVFERTGISPSQANFIYSQFEGYIVKSHKAFKQSLHNFVDSHKWKKINLHTSGHASKEALMKIVEISKPTTAIIPIHKERIGSFQQLNCPFECPIIEQNCCLNDIDIQIR